MRQIELQTRFPDTDSSRLRRLNAIFAYLAATDHPLQSYYRSRGLGTRPIVLESLKDLREIPVLDKQVLKDWHRDGLLYKSVPPGTVYSHTSGSTGAPFMTAVDPATARLRSLVEASFQRSAGLNPVMRELRIWRTKTLAPDMAELVRRGQIGFVFIDGPGFVKMSEEAQLRLLYERIVDFRPQVIRGYAGIIAKLAAYIHRTGASIPRLEVVLPVAEFLAKSEWRLCEQSFGCPVVNLYGGTEAPAVAISLGADLKFRVARNLYLLDAGEVIGQEGGQVSCEMLITDLSNRSMPLIRYKNGDLCAIDIDQSRYDISDLSEIVGRRNDVMTLPDSTTISPHVWFVAFRDLTWLASFQIHQNEQGDVELFYCPSMAVTSEQVLRLENAARGVCGRYLTSITQITRNDGLNTVKRKVITVSYQANALNKK